MRSSAGTERSPAHGLQTRTQRSAASCRANPHHHRALRCHRLPGRSPSSNLSCGRTHGASGGSSRRSTVSTRKIVDTNAEQNVLEDLIEETKPVVPDECRGLDYLLLTPFHDRPDYKGSRFRRPGISLASPTQRTIRTRQFDQTMLYVRFRD